jgi:signal transduction histidine kinase
LIKPFAARELLSRVNTHLEMARVRRNAYDQLAAAQAQLVQSAKMASLGQLVAGIAHEINNPVNAVINTIGPLDGLLHALGDVKDVKELDAVVRDAGEMLAVIQRGATRSKAIVQALHNYSRGDDEQPREVNLARSVDDTLDLLRHHLKNVRVEKDVDPTLRVTGFAGQIDQVLMNLVTNAAQAIGTREGGGTVRVAARRDGDRVEVTVRDDGAGIAPEVQSRIFDPFFTTKDVGEGSGLGLSIVHGIIERHGGSIAVDSVVGRGTTFTIRLPIQTAGGARAGARKV